MYFIKLIDFEGGVCMTLPGDVLARMGIGPSDQVYMLEDHHGLRFFKRTKKLDAQMAMGREIMN